jgi:hypothetical protein
LIGLAVRKVHPLEEESEAEPIVITHTKTYSISQDEKLKKTDYNENPIEQDTYLEPALQTPRRTTEVEDINPTLDNVPPPPLLELTDPNKDELPSPEEMRMKGVQTDKRKKKRKERPAQEGVSKLVQSKPEEKKEESNIQSNKSADDYARTSEGDCECPPFNPKIEFADMSWLQLFQYMQADGGYHCCFDEQEKETEVDHDPLTTQTYDETIVQKSSQQPALETPRGTIEVIKPRPLAEVQPFLVLMDPNKDEPPSQDEIRMKGVQTDKRENDCKDKSSKCKEMPRKCREKPLPGSVEDSERRKRCEEKKKAALEKDSKFVQTKPKKKKRESNNQPNTSAVGCALTSEGDCECPPFHPKIEFSEMSWLQLFQYMQADGGWHCCDEEHGPPPTMQTNNETIIQEDNNESSPEQDPSTMQTNNNETIIREDNNESSPEHDPSTMQTNNETIIREDNNESSPEQDPPTSQTNDETIAREDDNEDPIEALARFQREKGLI